MRPFCEPSPKSLPRAAEMVRGVDTNVLARWLMRDDPAQMRIADDVMAGPIEISHTVLVEVGWVLTSAGRMSRQQFAHVVSVILALRNASIEKRQELRWAVERYRAGADWADLVHLVSLASATHFATFDRNVETDAGPAAPIPIETLGR